MKDAMITNIQCRMHAMVAELEAMRAMNASRREQGYAEAYDSDAFHSLADRLVELSREAEALQ